MTTWRRLRTSTALAVVMLLIGVTGVLAQVLGEVGNRTHQLKQQAGAESETLPGTRISDALCEDGTATTTDAEGTEYTFACDGLDMVSFVPSAEMLTLRDPLTGCALDLTSSLGLLPINLGDPASDVPDPDGEAAIESAMEAGCLLEDTGISDIWGWTSPETGDEYVIFGKTNAAAFYNVTDPSDPQYYGEIPNLSGTLLWFDIKVNDDVAYIVSESAGYGVVAFDLTQLDDMGPAPTEFFPLAETSRFAPGGQDVTDLSNHNVVIDTDNDAMYLVGGNVPQTADGACAGGFYALDLRDYEPALGDGGPPFLGCAQAEGTETRTDGADEQAEDDTIYVHDAQCAEYVGPDAEHQGAPICIGSNEEIVVIFDMSGLFDDDPETGATELGRVAYPDASYSHQGWMDEQQRYYFNGDELDELNDSDLQGEAGARNTRTIVIDIQDLDAPFVETLYDHDTVAIDHNMYTHDGLLYQSNYTAGLRVFDVEQSVATFDGRSVGPKTEGAPPEDDGGGLPALPGDDNTEEPEEEASDNPPDDGPADGDTSEEDSEGGLGELSAASVSGDERLVETMFFDTFPDDDEEPVNEFSGAWSSYPYFESGVIPVTGIADGFFLLRPSELRPAGMEPTEPSTGAPADDGELAGAPSDDADDGAGLAATGGGALALLVGAGAVAAAGALRHRRDE